MADAPVKIGSITTPKYGWVTAKADKNSFTGFDKAQAEYKRLTGGNFQGAGWNAKGKQLLSWYDKNKGATKATGISDPTTGMNPWQKANDGLRGNDPWSRANTTPRATFDNPSPWKPTTGAFQNIEAQDHYRNEPLDWQGHVSNTTKALANPNYYNNPELQRYYDGPNDNVQYEFGDYSGITHSGDNTSKTLGGEDNVNNVRDWFKNNRSDPSLGTYSSMSGTSDPLVQKMQFGDKSFYYTPYDYAIAGLNGKLPNQDMSYWNSAKYYDPGSQIGSGSKTPYGFLTSTDPTMAGVNNLGTETTDVSYHNNDTGGSWGDMIGSIGAAGMGFIPGMQGVALAGMPLMGIPGTIGNLASMANGQNGPANPFNSYKPDTGPNFSGTTTPSTGGQTTVPNIMNPGTGGSNQTTSSLNKFNWNNVDYNVQGNNLFSPKGDLAWNGDNNTGTSPLGNAYKSYLGQL